MSRNSLSSSDEGSEGERGQGMGGGDRGGGVGRAVLGYQGVYDNFGIMYYHGDYISVCSVVSASLDYTPPFSRDWLCVWGGVGGGVGKCHSQSTGGPLDYLPPFCECARMWSLIQYS